MNDPDERTTPEPEQDPGLVDPRNLHPTPEGLFTDGTETSNAESDKVQREEASPERDIRGMVDPRSEASGPDL